MKNMHNSNNIKKQITIGIPAFNEEKNIKFLIESLLKQKLRNAILEQIIIVSDGSTDSTDKKVQSIKNNLVTLITNKKRVGLNRALNKIVQFASSDILVILNADILPANEYFIQNLIKPFFKNKNIGIVGANTISQPSRNLLERILVNSHELKQFMYARISNGNNVYMCHGRARAFSKNYIKK
jgi:glycosyltransferase involved in cell wall biosynthesis